MWAASEGRQQQQKQRLQPSEAPALTRTTQVLLAVSVEVVPRGEALTAAEDLGRQPEQQGQALCSSSSRCGSRHPVLELTCLWKKGKLLSVLDVSSQQLLSYPAQHSRQTPGAVYKVLGVLIVCHGAFVRQYPHGGRLFQPVCEKYVGCFRASGSPNLFTAQPQRTKRVMAPSCSLSPLADSWTLLIASTAFAAVLAPPAHSTFPQGRISLAKDRVNNQPTPAEP